MWCHSPQGEEVLLQHVHAKCPCVVHRILYLFFFSGPIRPILSDVFVCPFDALRGLESVPMWGGKQVSLIMTTADRWICVNVGVDGVDAMAKELSVVWLLVDIFSNYHVSEASGVYRRNTGGNSGRCHL